MITRRTSLAILIGAIATPVFAMEQTIYQANGIAINGTDPVAYFTQSAAVQGSSQYTFDWMGATWQFASIANRDMFAAAPAQYAPQFGGYCAYAASKNALAPTIPEAWTVYNGKLYLNFNQQARDLWRRDKDVFIALAEGYWPGILG